jgi:cellulose synthase/poly-beta-1,6-N-acetylglucosamine synthase-like glycosyltransferase
LTVVTVNKVQDVYATPVYEFTQEEGDVLEVMNQYMREGKALDVEGYYARQHFNSVHIGDFKLIEESKDETRHPRVAVVMPVYNQKPEYL